MQQLLELINALESLDSLDKDQALFKSNELKLQYIELNNTNPKLFKKLMDDPLNKENRERTKRMILLYSNIQSGKTTQHNASVEIGQELADQYLGHLLSNSKKRKLN